LNKSPLFPLFCLISFFCATATFADYSKHELVAEFIDEMVVEDNFDRTELEALFRQVEKKQSILNAISRPAERTLTWGGYRNIFLKQPRIDGGVDFWHDHADVLAKAEKEFGIPAEIIISIIGVETLYGGNTGSYRVMDALSTLAFDYPRRAPFFRSELRHFLILAREQNKQPLDLKGSYAGAMGLGQFMPSSYREYAADYEQDGFIDIWANRSDAIWSVANYLRRHHWKAGDMITVGATVDKNINTEVLNQSLKPELSLAQLKIAGIVPNSGAFPETDLATAMELETEQGTEYWIGLHNFYVITRYNHSKLYAMAVYQLAEEIRAGYEHSAN